MVADLSCGALELGDIFSEPPLQVPDRFDIAYPPGDVVVPEANQSDTLESGRLRLRAHDVVTRAVERDAFHVRYIGAESDRYRVSYLCRIGSDFDQENFGVRVVVQHQDLAAVRDVSDARYFELTACDGAMVYRVADRQRSAGGLRLPVDE